MSETTAKAAHIWERSTHDWYVEPKRVTRQLLSAETLNGPTCDPCCGQGHIVETLLDHQIEAFGLDIVQRTQADWFMGVSDFLGDGWGLGGARNCVFNPPFYKAAGAEACIRQALKLASGKVCAFLDIRFLTGSGRALGLFKDYPPDRIYVVTPRPSCPPGSYLAAGGVAGNGASDYIWLVWDIENSTGQTVTGWLS